MNPLYLSTGAFVGRINGSNIGLLTEYANAFACDGFEFMVFPSFYPTIDRIVAACRAQGVNVPVVHTDKHIGDLLSTPGDAAFAEAVALFTENCRIAQGLDAGKLVLHGWGIPDSDKAFDENARRIGGLLAPAQDAGLDLLVENCFCLCGSPLAHLEALAGRYPGLGMILDTRPAAFHDELAAIYESPLWQGSVRHLHINDYAGGYRQWDAMYPVPQPGQGRIDWPAFFAALRRNRYTGSITLEAPSMRAEGVDAETLNRGLDFIRKGLAD